MHAYPVSKDSLPAVQFIIRQWFNECSGKAAPGLANSNSQGTLSLLFPYGSQQAEMENRHFPDKHETTGDVRLLAL